MSTPILEKTFHRRSGILDARHHSLSTNSVFAVCAALVMVLLSYGNSLAEVTAKPRTNLTVIRDLAEVIGRRIGDSPGAAGIDTLSVSVEPRETAWYIESALIRGIAGSSRSVRLSKKGAVTAECAIGEIAVDYSDARADGLLGKTIVDRHVSVTISALVVLNASGEIFLNEDLYEGRTDTIELGAITTLENPNIPVTQGSLPGEGFFSSIAGPIILIGTIGVAVFLLFHVRS